MTDDTQALLERLERLSDWQESASAADIADDAIAHIEALSSALAAARRAEDAAVVMARGYQEALAAAERERDDAVAALRFYARESNWRSSSMYMCGHSGDSQATLDAGRKARAALPAEQENTA